MALNDDATLADKISLASDLKYRRDHDYAKALLWHIFPDIPESDQRAILKSHGLKEWLETDPRGEWCSHNDKAFMHMTVKNYIFNNRQRTVHLLSQMKADDGNSTMRTPEHTQLDDQLKHVLNSWRGPSLENLDEYIQPRAIIPRPEPLDNSISPRQTGFEIRKLSRSFEQAKAVDIGSQQYHERFLELSSHSKDAQHEKLRENLGNFGGAQEKMSRSEGQGLEEALSGMHLDIPPCVSKQKTSVGSSRAHDALIKHTQQISHMQRQFEAETHFRKSGNALMYACRRPTPRGRFVRRSNRLVNERLKKEALFGPPVKPPSGVSKKSRANRARRLVARSERRDQQCEQDLKDLRLNPNLELPHRRMGRICVRLGNVQRMFNRRDVAWTPEEKAALLEIASMHPSQRKRNQKIGSSAAPLPFHIRAIKDGASGSSAPGNDPSLPCERIKIEASAPQHPNDPPMDIPPLGLKLESMDIS